MMTANPFAPSPDPNDRIMAALVLLAMLPIFMPFGAMGLMFLGWLILIVYGCVAAVLVFMGRDFRYAIIGNRLARYLQKEQPAA